MTKIKKCSVSLVSENRQEIEKWIQEIKGENIFFKQVESTEIRECLFESLNITDYRSNVTFVSKASKNNIYWAMNQIKSNPIQFLN